MTDGFVSKTREAALTGPFISAWLLPAGPGGAGAGVNQPCSRWVPAPRSRVCASDSRRLFGSERDPREVGAVKHLQLTCWTRREQHDALLGCASSWHNRLLFHKPALSPASGILPAPIQRERELARSQLHPWPCRAAHLARGCQAVCVRTHRHLAGPCSGPALRLCQLGSLLSPASPPQLHAGDILTRRECVALFPRHIVLLSVLDCYPKSSASKSLGPEVSSLTKHKNYQ